MSQEQNNTRPAPAAAAAGAGAPPANRRGNFRGRQNRGRKTEEVWKPVTKLGRLVKAGKIDSIEQIFYHSLAIKEPEIVDALLPGLKDALMSVKSVQKQTTAGQRTSMKALVVVGDNNGHVGLGVASAGALADAIKKAIKIAKLNIQPVRRGYWGSALGDVHTIVAKTQGKCGSVTLKLIPAPRGTGLVASPKVKQFLEMAGINDVYTQSFGSTSTAENTLKACLLAVGNSYYLTPDIWAPTAHLENPLTKHSDLLQSKRLKE